TIVSTDEEDSPKRPDAGANKSANDTDEGAHGKSLDSIREMYAALRACWTPPPKDEARRGMEYTIRFAFRRDGEITAPPRRTYSSHEAPDHVRDTYRDAGGTARPSARAVLRLIANSYLVGACTGRSAGFSPLSMRSTYPAARRCGSIESAP